MSNKPKRKRVRNEKSLDDLRAKYGVHRDSVGCWTLTEMIPGTGKQGQPIVTEKHTYHGNAIQIYKAVLDRELGRCKFASDIIARIEEVEDALVHAIETQALTN